MLYRLRQRTQDESGFTLIELLVVILIIGILAAIAIPSFLSQKSKATDSQAKELARTAQTTAETFATDHNGEYTGLSMPELKSYEPSILIVKSTSEAYITVAEAAEENKGYVVTATSPSLDTFTVKKKAGGEVERTCTVAKGVTHGGCVEGKW